MEPSMISPGSQRTLKGRYSKQEGTLKPKVNLKLRHSLEDLLYRKLVAKYVERNPYFTPEEQHLELASHLTSPKQSQLPPIKVTVEAPATEPMVPEHTSLLLKFIAKEVKKLLHSTHAVS